MTSGPRPGVPERGLWIPDPAQRNDLAVFAERVLRLDPAAVIRLRTRADGLVGAWAVTGFDVLVARAVTGRVRPLDVTCAADRLVPGLRAADETGFYDQGYPMDSAWRGGLPPETGFVRLDDVPAAVFADLAHQGAELARESGSAQGPPTSLMDQEVLTVIAGDAGGDTGGDTSAGVPMRCVLALEAMRFVPDPAPESELVRVSVHPAWLRIDARFGSVFRRRGDHALLLG